MQVRSAVAAAVLLVAVGCETPTETPDDPIRPGADWRAGQESAVDVPFAANLAGEVRFDSPSTPTQAIFEGSGQATHMGATLNSGSAGPLQVQPAPGCPGGFGIPNVHAETLTAADGDQLLLELNDLACPVDETFMVFQGTGSWTVVGGSGRFADAAGSGSVQGVADFLDGVFELSFTGDIRY